MTGRHFLALLEKSQILKTGKTMTFQFQRAEKVLFIFMYEQFHDIVVKHSLTYRFGSLVTGNF